MDDGDIFGSYTDPYANPAGGDATSILNSLPNAPDSAPVPESVLATQSNTALSGDNNSLPTVSTNTSANSNSYGQVLGSVTPANATNLGTALGTLVKNVQSLPAAFQKGYQPAASGNSLATWWNYASTTDKLVVGVGVLTLVYMIMEHK